jgi:hypothetical protein
MTYWQFTKLGLVFCSDWLLVVVGWLLVVGWGVIDN